MNSLMAMLILQEAIASSAIEGITLTEEEKRQLIESILKGENNEPS